MASGSRQFLQPQRAKCSASAAGPEFAVVRYHSLAVDEATLPASLQAVAWARGVQPSHAVAAGEQQQGARTGNSAAQLPRFAATEGVIGSASAAAGSALEEPVLMGLVHRHRPHYAVQVCVLALFRFTGAVRK